MNLFVMCCGGKHSRPWKGNCIYGLLFNNSASPSKTVEDIYLLGAQVIGLALFAVPA